MAAAAAAAAVEVVSEAEEAEEVAGSEAEAAAVADRDIKTDLETHLDDLYSIDFNLDASHLMSN